MGHTVHTACSPAIPRTPRTNTKKLVMKKESGRKRKTAEPSSGSITKYLVKERKDTGDDKGDRGGLPAPKKPIDIQIYYVEDNLQV